METNLRSIRVKDIILNKNHLRYESLGKEDSIGTILFTDVNDNSPLPELDLNTLPFAKPLFSFLKQYPIRDEIVLIISSNANDEYYGKKNIPIFYYLPPIDILKNVNQNSLPAEIVDGEVNYGKYFKPNFNLKPLRTYEGDTLIEGRFGNSIRFGSTVGENDYPNSWSSRGQNGDPITIIRNGQKNSKSVSLMSHEHILEDINEDDSSIYLTSNQKIDNFIPASLNDESYLTDIFVKLDQEEPSTNETVMEDNVSEDVSLTPVSNIPAEELQQNDELRQLNNPDIAYYDSSPTEPNNGNQQSGDEAIAVSFDTEPNEPNGINYDENLSS